MITSLATPLYLYFIAFVVPSKVLMEVSARFGFLHRNRFFRQPDFSITILSVTPGSNIGWIWTFFTVILIWLRNLDNLQILDLSHGSALNFFCLYGLFCFDRFCLFFCTLYFTVFCVVLFSPQGFSSCSLCTKVLGVFVSRLNMRIFYMH